MAWRVRGGELPLSLTLVDPELHYGQISTTQKPFPRENAHSRTLYIASSLLLDAQSSCVVFLVVLSLVRCLRWKMGTKLGRSQLHVRLVGGFSRARTVGASLLSRLDAAETLHLPCLSVKCGFLERLTARSSGVQKCGGRHGGLHGISSDLERYAG